jgi:glucose/mannose-6-phosphate isomerase
VGLTSGGELQERGQEHGFPLITLPQGLPPRAALGCGLGGLLWVLHRLGLTRSPRDEIDAAVAVLQEGTKLFGGQQPLMTNPCAQLAQTCLQRFPVIYTTSAETHGVGQRWKAQLNENAKCPAYTVPFPELNHNDIVGWRITGKRKQDFILLVLRSQDEHPRTAQRVAITADLLRQEFFSITTIHSRGEKPLARILSLVQYGDYLSCHLAVAAGEDPVPVERIELLKERLQKGNDAC